MTFSKRVDGLEASLQPEMIILRWLDQMSKFRSRSEYVSWCHKDPSRFPLNALVRELEQFEKSKSANKVSKAQSWTYAAEDIVYRVHLVDELNASVESLLKESRLDFLKFELTNPARLPPVPMSEEMASVVQHAAENYVMPLDQFCTRLAVLIAEQQRETGPTSTREAMSLVFLKIVIPAVATGALEIGMWVDLGQLQYRLLGRASLVEGEWVDCRIVDLAEYAALLRIRGYDFQKPTESHPLEELTPVRADGNKVRAEDLLAIWKEAKAKLRGLRARTVTIQGQAHLNIDDYRNWDGRAVVGALEAFPGINVASWNRLLDSRKDCAGLLLHLGAPFSSRNVLICKSEEELRRERRVRQQELQKIGPTIGGLMPAERRTICLYYSLLELELARDLADRVRQLFGGRQVLFKETQESLDELTQCAAGLCAPTDLLDQSEQHYHGDGGLETELDSVFGFKGRSKHLLKILRLSAKHATLQLLGRVEPAEKARLEIVASKDADLKAAKACIARLKNKIQQRGGSPNNPFMRAPGSRKREFS